LFHARRLIEKDRKGWKQKREMKLKELARNFCAHGYTAAKDKIVSRVSLISGTPSSLVSWIAASEARIRPAPRA